MESSSLDNIEQRLEATSAMPVEDRVEELGKIHDQLKSFLDSTSS
jgi:hypothetical protein